MPKTDLHCHLDGSLRESTIVELAAENGVTLPATDEEGLRKAMHAGEICDDLVEYLSAFGLTCSVLQTEGALRRVAFELAEDAAAENVRYLEVRYAPILHTNEGLRLDQIVQAVLDGLGDAEKKYDIKTGLIICGIRNMTPATSLRIAELAVAFKNRGVVGFDLAGAEEDHPAKAHVKAFQLILNNNINVTIHAGEAYGPLSIAQAIHYCGAHRIGHGTRLRESGDLLQYVNDHRIPLEVCLKSNIQTRSVSSLDEHPFKFYLDLGLRVTLNTDNRLITLTTMTDEYMLAVREWNLTFDELRWVMTNGFKSAFLPFREKTKLMRRAAAEYDALVAERRNPTQTTNGKPAAKKSSESSATA
jgi:adenosine deaminase